MNEPSEDMRVPELTYRAEQAAAYLKASGWLHAGNYSWIPPNSGALSRLTQDEAVKLQFSRDLCRLMFVFNYAKDSTLSALVGKAAFAFVGELTSSMKEAALNDPNVRTALQTLGILKKDA